jgi:hypothetical protein
MACCCLVAWPSSFCFSRFRCQEDHFEAQQLDQTTPSKFFFWQSRGSLSSFRHMRVCSGCSQKKGKLDGSCALVTLRLLYTETWLCFCVPLLVEKAHAFRLNLQIPYQTNKAAMVEKIAELVNNKVSLSHVCLACKQSGDMKILRPLSES